MFSVEAFYTTQEHTLMNTGTDKLIHTKLFPILKTYTPVLLKKLLERKIYIYLTFKNYH